MIKRRGEELLHALGVAADASTTQHFVGVLEMELKVSTREGGSEISVTVSNVISREGDGGEISNRRQARIRPHINTIVLEGELNRLHDAGIGTRRGNVTHTSRGVHDL